MDKLDLELAAYKELTAKEFEYEDFIADHKRQLVSLEENRADIYSRRVDLSRLIDDEQSYMRYFLEKIDGSEDTLKTYGIDLDSLLGESAMIYQQQISEIDDKESDLREKYHRKRIEYEEEIERLRRVYVSTHQ